MKLFGDVEAHICVVGLPSQLVVAGIRTDA